MESQAIFKSRTQGRIFSIELPPRAMLHGDAYFAESGDLIPFKFMISRPTYRQRIDALKQELQKKRSGSDKG